MFKAKEFIGTGKECDADRAVQLLQEAQLFIDAAHDCHNKLRSGSAGGAKLDSVASPSA
jgi:cellobiose-specific phosphotransferase system component IIA